MFTKRLERRLRGLLVLAGLVVLVLPVTSSSQLLPRPPGGSVTVCQVTGSASAPQFAEVQVAVDQVAAYLNQFPGSFVGSCPESGSNSGSLSGTVRVCRVSGSASAPILSEVVVAVDQLQAYLAQNPGSFAGPCPASGSGGNAGRSDGTGPLNAVVTVCRVTGNVSAPEVAQLTLDVDRVAAFLNQNPGSFIGTCPGEGGRVTQGPGRILGIPAGAALSICRVTAAGDALRFAQVNVAIDRFAAYLNQHAGSFVGLCPSGDDPNGTAGNEPIGYITICSVTAALESGLVAQTIQRRAVRAYLARPGTVVPAPTAGCPAVRETPQQPPTTVPPNRTTPIVVDTTPNTVVTATGAGVKTSAKSNKKGKAKINVRPKRPGVITVRAAGGKPVKRIGVAADTQSAAGLTG